MKNIAIIGAGGGIGHAVLHQCGAQYPAACIYTLSRTPLNNLPQNCQGLTIDITDETSIEAAADKIEASLDLIFVATGILHGEAIHPEKALRDLDSAAMQKVFMRNTFGPALLLKHFMPKLKKEERAVMALLSARVGSIGDNKIGGWYSYRASKAALNMIIKCAAIEAARRFKHQIILGLHPGTVDTKLSEPFQGHVPEGKLFTPDYSAAQMMSVLQKITPEDSGKILDYAGMEIEP